MNDEFFRQIHFGAPWPLSFVALLRTKISDANLHRKIALEGHRFTPKDALQAGIIDYIVDGNTEAILAKAEQVAEFASPLAREGVWGIIKVSMLLVHGSIIVLTYCPAERFASHSIEAHHQGCGEYRCSRG